MRAWQIKGLYRRAALVGLLFSAAQLFAQQLSFRFANVELVAGSPAVVKFEIHMGCDVAGTWQVGGNIYLKYNRSAFGSALKANDKVLITPLQLLPPPFYSTSVADFNDSVLSVNWYNGPALSGQSPNTFIARQIPTTLTPLCRLEIQVNSVPEAVIAFDEDLMNTLETMIYSVPGTPPQVLAYPAPYLFGSEINATSLPVTWLDIRALRLPGDRVSLRWSTARERNTGHFTIQRSQDNRLFQDMGSVNAAGDSDDPRYYQWEDPVIALGPLYYRLKQVDLDGVFSYSRTVSVHVDSQWGRVAFDIPAKFGGDFFEVKVHGLIEEGHELYFFDSAGRTVSHVRILPGSRQEDVPAGHWGAGLYGYRAVQGNTLIQSGRIVKNY